MQAPITVNYTPDGEDWTVTVVGRDQTRSAKAAGLIAARDQADQLVEQIAPNDDRKTVVHLLDGDAFKFTTTYLHTRLGLREQAFGDRPWPTDAPDATEAAQPPSTTEEKSH